MLNLIISPFCACACSLQFVDFTEIMSREMSEGDKEDEFTLEALMKIPAQHDAIISQNIRYRCV